MAVVKEDTWACNVAKDRVGAVFIKKEEENRQTTGGPEGGRGEERESATEH